MRHIFFISAFRWLFLIIILIISPSIYAQHPSSANVLVQKSLSTGRNIKMLKLRTGRGMVDQKLVKRSEVIKKDSIISAVIDLRNYRPQTAHFGENATLPNQLAEAPATLTQPAKIADALMMTATGLGYEPNKIYEMVDKKVSSLSLNNNMAINAAAQKIINSANAKSFRQKARALYTWIAKNIEHDSKDTIRTAQNTFQARKGMSEGYALLYKEMADALGLECYFVIGELKPFGYEKGMETDYHAWNIVSDGTEVIILDTYLSAGYTNEEGESFTHLFNDEWFDVDPYLMIYSHYPKCGEFQYVNTYLSPDQFKEIPRLEPKMKWAGIDERKMQSYLYGHKKSWSPLFYNEAQLYIDGVRCNKLQMTNTLQIGKEYRFNFTVPEGITLWAQTGPTAYEIKDAKDLVINPSQEGELIFFYSNKKNNSGRAFIKYKVATQEPDITYTRINTFTKKTSYTPEEADEMCLSTVTPQKQLVIYPGRTSIQFDEFRNRTDFESVDIPTDVITIGYRAFENCSNLKQLNIPNSAFEVGARAYFSCKNLQSATIGSKTIQKEAFWDCSSLSDLAFTGNVSKIEDKAFAYCPQLTDVSLGDFTTSIGDFAFWSGTGTLRLYVPESVTKIGDLIIHPADRIIVPASSYVRQYVQKNGFKFQIEE